MVEMAGLCKLRLVSSFEIIAIQAVRDRRSYSPEYTSSGKLTYLVLDVQISDGE